MQRKEGALEARGCCCQLALCRGAFAVLCWAVTVPVSTAGQRLGLLLLHSRSRHCCC
jgi:hypothetical protein